jgi:hypothetical protein
VHAVAARAPSGDDRGGTGGLTYRVGRAANPRPVITPTWP